MNTKIIAIGNSQGVRLPKTVLRRAGLELGTPLTIDVQSGSRVVLTPNRHPREGWEEAFRRHPPRKSDYPWREVSPTLASDDKEWTW